MLVCVHTAGLVNQPDGTGRAVIRTFSVIFRKSRTFNRLHLLITYSLAQDKIMIQHGMGVNDENRHLHSCRRKMISLECPFIFTGLGTAPVLGLLRDAVVNQAQILQLRQRPQRIQILQRQTNVGSITGYGSHPVSSHKPSPLSLMLLLSWPPQVVKMRCCVNFQHEVFLLKQLCISIARIPDSRSHLQVVDPIIGEHQPFQVRYLLCRGPNTCVRFCRG